MNRDKSVVNGVRMVETRPSRVAVTEPWRAGEFDPPMQDWLKLPATDSCPVDAAHKRWGTRNPCGYFLVRFCKDCRAELRGEVTARMIHDVVGALTGQPRRLLREYLDDTGDPSTGSDGA